MSCLSEPKTEYRKLTLVLTQNGYEALVREADRRRLSFSDLLERLAVEFEIKDNKR